MVLCLCIISWDMDGAGAAHLCQWDGMGYDRDMGTEYRNIFFAQLIRMENMLC